MRNLSKLFNKLHDIPDDKWATGRWNTQDKCCVLGHLGETDQTASKGTDESNEFRALVEKIGDDMGYVINDGGRGYIGDEVLDFTELGDTPKERVLNALILIESGIFNERF